MKEIAKYSFQYKMLLDQNTHLFGPPCIMFKIS